METAQEHPEAPTAEEAFRGAQQIARPLVYFVVAIGAAVSVLSVLISSGTFTFAVAIVTLLSVVPYLVFARLALLQPGADAVVGGIVLLATGAWGSISYLDSDLRAFVYLPMYLIAIELLVFAIGAALRLIGAHPTDSRRQ
jgi:hypothetical protein